MDLSSSLTTYSQEVYVLLDEFFDEQKRIATSIDGSLLTSIRELHDFVVRGGKAIRPFLSHLAYTMAGGENSAQFVKIAGAIELHHKHILILDDIADRDEERYGGPTVEYSYRKLFAGNPQVMHRALSFAMLDAVWLGGLARELLAQAHFPKERLLACHGVLNTLMFRDTLAGWQIHARECDRKLSQVTPQEFIKGLELVTARYTFEGPFKIGLIMAGSANQKLSEALTTYSRKVGTAFQIHDDILGLFGDTAKTGKPVGNDVREGKKTLLVQEAYARTDIEGKRLLDKSLGNPKLSTSQITAVQDLVRSTGALEHSLALEKKMVKEGIDAITSLPESEPKQLLIELAQFVISRDR